MLAKMRLLASSWLRSVIDLMDNMATLSYACCRFAVAAFVIIATVRGFLLNFGVYSATRAALGLPFCWSPAIV